VDNSVVRPHQAAVHGQPTNSSIADTAFTQVYDRIVRSLGGNDLKLYLLLCSYAGRKDTCWPSDTTLAKWMKSSPSTVQRGLQRLAGAGLITRTQVEWTAVNPTGRVIVTHGRVALRAKRPPFPLPYG